MSAASGADEKLASKPVATAETIVIHSDHASFPAFQSYVCCGFDIFTRATPPNTITCAECKKSIDAKAVGRAWSAPFGVPQPRAFVVKMSVGKLSTYNDSCLLHIGVSDSNGNVYSFDERGRRCDDLSQWSHYFDESVSVPIVHAALTDTAWDQKLAAFLVAERKHNSLYTPIDNNCYAFAVGFLNSVSFESRTNHTKDDIVIRFIGPAIRELGAFLTISRALDPNKPKSSFVRYRRPANASAKGGLSIDDGKQTKAFVCDFCAAVIAPHSHYRCMDKACSDTDLCGSCYAAKRSNATHKPTHTIRKQ